jgi:hypothetical protein
MSEIFSDQEQCAETAAAQREQLSREMAACYARIFSTADGQRVLADLRRKFGLQRLVFKTNSAGRYDYLDAALRDGERRVLSEIEGALLLAESGH